MLRLREILRCCFVWQLAQHAHSMLAKRSLGIDLDALDPAKRFRHNAADMVLSNEVSARRGISLFSDAELSGARHVHDLSRMAKGKGQEHRDLLRALRKGSKWPKPYQALIRVHNTKTGEEEKVWLPFFLPHELLAALLSCCSDISAFMDRSGMDCLCREHLGAAENELGLVANTLVGVGLWLDGVPCNWDRSESVECVTLNMPGLSGKFGNLRMPIALVEHRYVLKHKTFDDIFAVVAWSLRQCAIGKQPSRRHDNLPWLKSDAGRRKAKWYYSKHANKFNLI